MTKKTKILCPICKADLKRVGFITCEEARMNFEWKWSGKFFKADDGELDGDGEIISAFCNNCCEEDILDFVRKHNLI